MRHKKLTKLQMKRLRETTPDVRIMNGTYQQVTFTVKFSRYAFVLRLNLVHPLLQELTHFNKAVNTEWIEYETAACSTGYVIHGLPEGLDEFIKEQVFIYSMGDATAKKCLKEFAEAFEKYKQEMCI